MHKVRNTSYKVFTASASFCKRKNSESCYLAVKNSHAQLLSRVWLFATLWTVAHQAPLSMGFPSLEYWSGLPFPSPEDLPNPGIEPTSPADGYWSHEIKRCLLLGRKVMTNLDSIFKSRDITLSAKVRLVKAMVFPVVMYGCESWTIKKAEPRIDAFELWCWRRLLRVPWTARRSSQPS